jgi:hypothetical protein
MNAFNLGRVTMKPNERLRNYTNRFFENCNACVGVRDDQVVESYKKGVRDCKIFKKIHESGATTVAALRGRQQAHQHRRGDGQPI